MQNETVRVLMIGPSRSVHGGISGVVNNYYEAGLDKKIDLEYISTMVEGSKSRKLLQAIFACIRFCLIVKHYDIVHINMASDSSYYRKSVFIRMAKWFHKKIVIHQHGGNFNQFFENELSEKARKKVKKNLAVCDAFIVLAPVWKDFFKNIVKEDKIVILQNSVEIPAAYTKQYGQHRILFLGRICKKKGIAELLEVMPKVAEKCPDVQLYLGGIWEDKELKAIAEQQKEHIKEIGWITGREKEKYLKECDIFVLPSYFEGQPVSVLEAMANYCAVLTTDIDGVTLMIQENKTGKLCEPKSSESLKNGLLELLQTPSLCATLGKNAREKVEQEFAISKNIEQLLQIYQNVLER